MSAEDAIKTSIDELRSLLSEADHFLANSGEATEEKVAALRERVRTALDAGRSQFARVRESAREQALRCDAYVHENPYYAIGAAAIIGALAGMIIGRRG